MAMAVLEPSGFSTGIATAPGGLSKPNALPRNLFGKNLQQPPRRKRTVRTVGSQKENNNGEEGLRLSKCRPPPLQMAFSAVVFSGHLMMPVMEILFDDWRFLMMPSLRHKCFCLLRQCVCELRLRLTV